MQQIITSQSSYINKNLNYPTNGSHLTTSNNTDLLTKLLNAKITQGIESYARSFSEQQKEVFKYIAYYWRKWGGNIQIPIDNICDRFKYSRRWVHVILKSLYEAGLVITTKGGYGRKVTRRTFTERGEILITAITKGIKAAKEHIPKKSADYYADYSRTHTINISSKVDILKGNNIIKDSKSEEKAAESLFKMRSLLKLNE